MSRGTALVTGTHGLLGRYTARAFAEQAWTGVGLGHGDWQRAEWERWGLASWHTCDIDTMWQLWSNYDKAADEKLMAQAREIVPIRQRERS